VELEGFVAKAKQGDPAALEKVLAEVAPAVRRFGVRMCRNPSDADDVLQDTLLNIATHLPEFEGRSSLLSWVFTLTRTACSRRRRGLKNQPPIADDVVQERRDEAPSPEARAAEHEIGQALVRALDSISDEQREVLLLRDVEGLSAQEAAEAIGISVDALKSRLHRARGALRDAFVPLVETPSPSCPDVVLQWSRKLEGDLSATDCSAMEKHLSTCPACTATCDSLKQALLACRRSSDEVPPEVQARVKAAVRAWTANLSAR
jgi:RNA polymerase sigma-70 factor, ECF subfamily